MDTILVLDFGSQTTQLISRRIRDRGVYSRVLPGDHELTDDDLEGVKGIVLSGSPHSVHDDDAPVPSPRVYDGNLPVLGICYGLQRLVQDHGGVVDAGSHREYGPSRQYIEPGQETPASALYNAIPDGFTSWMSHGDSIVGLPAGAEAVSRSENGLIGTVSFSQGPFLGIQYHPEVSHCDHGSDILENFAVAICGAKKEWNLERYREDARESIRRHAGDRPVLLLISGGVDSTVAAALLLDAMDPEQVHLMYVDTGLMRNKETAEVTEALKRFGAKQLYIVDAEARFLDALAGVEDPEEKRKRIGDLFVEIQASEVSEKISAGYLLAQGTLYTDLIESGKGVGKKARVIKSHHNVRTPRIEALRDSGELLEPLSALYKDEVRRLGSLLGLPKSIVSRHPFPGPGLAVRILGEVTKERCDILRSVDEIYLEEIRAAGLYDEIWQAFAVLLPIRSVGVRGDDRGYGLVAGLRAVTSRDGMTADAYDFPPGVLRKIAARVTNRVPEVGRVVYDVSSKPPSTIEWE